MSENLVISENCCNINVLKIKSLQTIIAIITEDKVTEIFGSGEIVYPRTISPELFY